MDTGELFQKVKKSVWLVKSARVLLKKNVWFIAATHALIVISAFFLAWLLRFDFSLRYRDLIIPALPLLVGIRLLTMRYFKLLHGWWAYAGISDVVDIAKAVSVGSVLFVIVMESVIRVKGFPRSIYLSEGLLTAGFLALGRLSSRILAESVRQDTLSSKKAVIIGAGRAGRMVVRELRQRGSGYHVAAVLDDDPTKQGLKLEGVPVLGSVDRLKDFVQRREGHVVIIAVPSATASQMRRFVEICQSAGVLFRTVPSLRELIAGDALLEEIRDVNLDDLLGRDPVHIDSETLYDRIAGRVVMVTGAAGSIGSELCRQIVQYKPLKLVCVDHDEGGIFHLQSELKRRKGPVEQVFCVADIGNYELMARICGRHEVGAIFHAAAYKHVPVMEENIEAAIDNNIFGLRNLLNVAEEAGCKDFILISTDKAVNPSSVMGATKRICELMVASYRANGLRCVSVRFGNVLGSSGSVVPIFQEQLRNDQPLTVTHPDIERFFMTIQEAVSLVLQAFAIGSHGEILVLDMGQPVKVVDLARTLIGIVGKTEHEVPIHFTGLRPGEKLFEELFYESERVTATSHPKIKRASGRVVAWNILMEQLDHLSNAIRQGDTNSMRMTIRDIVPACRFGEVEPVASPAHVHISETRPLASSAYD